MKKILQIVGVVCILIGIIGVISTNFNFGNTGTAYEKEWKFTNEELKNLNLESSYSVELLFVKSTNGNNSIQISGNMPEDVIQRINETVVSGQTLDLILKEKNRFINFMDFSGFEKQRIVVSLSDQASLDSVNTRMSSSSINITDLQTKIANIDSSSGSVKIENLIANEVNLGSSSGSITANGLQANQIMMKATSGSIKGERIQGNVDASASSGSIKLVDLTGDQVIMKSTSGSIHITNLVAKKSDIRASSGSVRITVPQSFGGSYDLNASSGSISAPESKRLTNDLLKVRTSSGSITINEE